MVFVFSGPREKIPPGLYHAHWRKRRFVHALWILLFIARFLLFIVRFLLFIARFFVVIFGFEKTLAQLSRCHGCYLGIVTKG